MCFSCVMSAQTNVKTHIVKANETLSSIAKRYGVAVNEILRESPNTAKNIKAGKGLIVGQRLNIPVKKSAGKSAGKPTNKPTNKPAAKPEPKPANRPVNKPKAPEPAPHSADKPKPAPEPSKPIISSSNNSSNSDYTENLVSKNTGLDYGNSRAGKTAFAIETLFGYLFPDVPDGTETTAIKLGASVALGARYHLTEEIFAEGFAGVKGLTFTQKFKGVSDKMHVNIWDVTIPLHVGYRLNTSTQGSYKIFAGTRIDIPFYNKQEFKTIKTKMDIPTSALIEAGIDINFPKTDCRIMYSYSPSDKCKYHLISIGFTTSTLFNF